MPFKWKRGTNPYTHNYFGKLRVGPHATQPQIFEKAKQLTKKLMAGEKVELEGLALDDQAIGEAATKLRDAGSLAQELLLMHSQPQGDNKKLKSLAQSMRQAARLPEERKHIALIHPAAIFWLIPAPGPEAAGLPECDALGLVGPNDESDLALDIVFDS